MATRTEMLDGDPRHGRQGGEWAWAALYEKHAPRLFRLAYWALLGNRDRAAEVVSRAFAGCAAAAAAGEPAELIGRRWEGMSVRALRESLPLPGSQEAASCGAAPAGISSLLPEQRLAFLLHDGAGYPLERCAELLELAPPACRRLLFAARLQLCQSGGVETPAA
ncbi:MAG: sigma factor-like helix-turn-helix DNA-binding protein [Terriglobales bacterium]